MTKRVTHPWKLNVGTAGGPIEEKCRSQPAVYRETQKVREQVAAGTGRASSLAVHQWNRDAGRWQLFERLPLMPEDSG